MHSAIILAEREPAQTFLARERPWKGRKTAMTELEQTQRLSQALRSALRHLYDPVSLAQSSLIGSLGLSKAQMPAMGLQAILLEGIDAMRPATTTAPTASARRYYELLHQRYVEQFVPERVASDLAVSQRTYRRLHQQALGELVAHLVRTGHLKVAEPESQPGAPATAQARAKELYSFRDSTSLESVDLGELVESALKIALVALHVQAIDVRWPVIHSLPRVSVRAIALRHVLTSLLVAVCEDFPRVSLRITGGREHGRVRLSVQVMLPTEAHGSVPDSALDLVHDLVLVANAEMIRSARPQANKYTVSLLMDVAEGEAVLVVDDNEDTLRLYERYLRGSRFRYEGCRQPDMVLTRAQDLQPRVIVLDLMLPGMDGWELLAMLQQELPPPVPPIVISSILPQAKLALALGASALVQKPVSREGLLKLLDELAKRPAVRAD